MIIIKSNAEFGKISQMFFTYLGYELLRTDAFPVGFQHDRCAVGIIRAHVITCVAALFLEAHPDIRLNIFDQMTQMNRAVGIG